MMNSPKEKKYRSKFLPLFLAIALCTGLLGLLLSMILTGFDIRAFQWKVVFAVIFLIAWSLTWTTIIVLYYTITISESGIKGYNFWGGYRFVEWGTTKECRTMNLLGLKYLRIFTLDNRLPLWVPMFLNHLQDFKRNIINLTDQGNCMRSYFEKERG